MRLIKWPFLFTICLFCFQTIFAQETERYKEYYASEFVDIDESDEEIATEISLLKARLNINYTSHLIFSHESGYYDEGFDLSIKSDPQSEHSIFYTLDGSIPTPNSHRYQEESPIEITPDTLIPFSATVIRARSYLDTIATSQIISKTYLVHPDMEERFSFPIISLITDPDNFFDYEIGIYVKGINHDPSNSTWSGNWFMTGIEWERDVHLQYFTTSGEMELDQAAGVRIHGGMQRNAPQKSLRLYARSEYGQNVFNYRLLPQKDKTEYKRFILRTSYGCWNETVIKDPMAASLVKGLNFDVQDYRPVIVLLNGEYWGIQTIRDYQGTHHLAEKYNLDKDSINIGQDEHVYEGSTQKYIELEKILDSMDLSASSTLHEIEKKLDINSTINYYNTEIYLNNYDWPAGNRRWWNTREYDDGKMHWLLFDLDAAFGARGGVSHNLLEQATVPSDSWPNPPNRTKLISSLLKNETFKNEFITRAAYLMNYYLHADTIIPAIYRMKAEYAPEMQEHIKRWNFRTYASWENKIESALVNFARDRRKNVNQHYISKFGLSGTSKLTAEVNNSSMGQVYINDMPVHYINNTGEYFNDVPIRLTAVPKNGYYFSHWADSSGSNQETITRTLSSNLSIEAVFAPRFKAKLNLKINEVMSKNSQTISDNFDEYEDWIEIYNRANIPINLAGLYISDDPELPYKWKIPDHFPDITSIKPHGFLLFFADNETHQGILHCNFKLNSSGETIILTEDVDGIPVIIDSMTYQPLSESFSWGRSPDGSEFCTEFSTPSPGAPNLILASKIPKFQASGFHVFPNPAGDFIHVFLNSEKKQSKQLTFFNISGSPVQTVRLYGSENTIDISDLHPGVYILRIQNDPGLNFKLIVK